MVVSCERIGVLPLAPTHLRRYYSLPSLLLGCPLLSTICSISNSVFEEGVISCFEMTARHDRDRSLCNACHHVSQALSGPLFLNEGLIDKRFHSTASDLLSSASTC